MVAEVSSNFGFFDRRFDTPITAAPTKRRLLTRNVLLLEI